jgi:uncharacterized protein
LYFQENIRSLAKEIIQSKHMAKLTFFSTPKVFSNLFLQFFIFLKKPTYKTENLATKTKIISLLLFWIFYVILLTPYVAVYVFLDTKDILPEHIVFQKLEGNNALLFASVVILAPLFEELFFRFPLNSPKWSLGIIVISIFGYFLPKLLLLFLPKINQELLTLFILSISSMAFSVYEPSRKMKLNWKKHFKWVFYVVAFLFGMVHIGNFSLNEITWQWYFLLPFLVIPQLVMGLFLGYIRLRYGLLFSIIFHAFHNLIFILPNLLMPE